MSGALTIIEKELSSAQNRNIWTRAGLLVSMTLGASALCLAGCGHEARPTLDTEDTSQRNRVEESKQNANAGSDAFPHPNDTAAAQAAHARPSDELRELCIIYKGGDACATDTWAVGFQEKLEARLPVWRNQKALDASVSFKLERMVEDDTTPLEFPDIAFPVVWKHDQSLFRVRFASWKDQDYDVGDVWMVHELALLFATLKKDPAYRITGVDHWGLYRGPKYRNGRARSRHNAGLAFDIKTLFLANGESLSVETDWNNPSRPKAARLLKNLYSHLKTRFDVVLGPDDNEDHKDHIHIDLDPKRRPAELSHCLGHETLEPRLSATVADPYS